MLLFSSIQHDRASFVFNVNLRDRLCISLILKLIWHSIIKSLMPKLTALLLLCVGLSLTTLAQKAHLTGTVSDTAEKKNLSNGSVLLLRPSDSILVKHTRTDASGRFDLKDIPTGKYLIVVTYPAYADYVDELTVKDSGTMTLPVIGMVLRSKLLQEVVVNGNKGAIRLKGDTTEFNADSFRTQPNATVEDLLKKLPGIQVDKNGKITAQGQAVKKVLVDGEEFFGDDPTLVTQNLRADMVDKVQVYDKKSDQASFTGIDDGVRDKTINLKLKDGKKNGYFGRATAGAGTEGYHDYELMANYFRKKEKLAAYGIISNTGKTGLTWNERDNYGQSFIANADVDENTGIISVNNSGENELDSWSGQYEGQGIPSVKTGGLHYNNKWNDEMQSLNGNYKYMQLNVNGNSTTNSQYILPDTLYYNNQRQAFKNQIIRHSFNGVYEYKIDSTSSIKIQADGGTDHKITSNGFHSEALAIDSSLVNQNDRTTSTISDKRVVNSNLLWRKKLAKKGRTFSLNLRENYTDNASDGFLNSNTHFYQNGADFKDSLIDQYKDFHTRTLLFDSRATYTEPISKKSFLSISYGITINNSHSDRSSFNKVAGGKYTALDSLYSNDYQYNVFAHKGGLSYILIKKKLRFTAGTDLGLTSFNQTDLRTDTSYKRNFVNWYPNASVTYSFTNMRRLTFQYVGNTAQPEVTQIQPILTNEDPLNITIGNPALKPSFSNRFNVYFNDYKVISDRGIWANLGYNFTQNAISNSVYVDSVGKRVSQYVNVNGNRGLYGWIGYNFKWAKPDLHFDLHINFNQNANVSVVNNLQNKTNSGTYTTGAGFWKSKEKKYEIGFNYSASYTRSTSTINSGITTHYFTQEIQPSGDYYLPYKFQVHADCNINLRQKTSVFDNNNNVVLLNAWIGRKFLKNDALLIKAAGNDLLNQNLGFNRTVNSNFISQNTYTTIKRYFMFTAVWNFTKKGTPAPARN